jgi:hypothetical protein
VDPSDRIKLGYELFNRRDWDAIARGLPDDFEAVDHVPPDERREHGPDALRAITTANGDAAFDNLRMEVVEVELVDGAGDELRAAVRIAASASGGTSGAAVEAEIGQLWTYRGGVPCRFEQFRTWQEARSAALPPARRR